ncbi:glutathione S-transferase family protein [Acetobacteraceae bacterium H6797]|nr:glutathione S-transferase family protein [Acetobacteraceae bacterium H6797]
MTVTLFELCGADPDLRFSPFCWRSRLALAHKGLEVESMPWRFTEIERLEFADYDKVPVLVDGDKVVTDSWNIAVYLEATYPDRPALFAGGPAAQRFMNAWADTVLNPALGRMILCDIPALLTPKGRDYFLTSREKRFGMSVEAFTAGREARLPALRELFAPVRAVLRHQPFLGGSGPDYGDYAVMGSLMWARCVSPLALLDPADEVYAWRERMLDLHGGLARKAPCVESQRL